VKPTPPPVPEVKEPQQPEAEDEPERNFYNAFKSIQDMFAKKKAHIV
jgi:hypothetical protein